MSAALSFVSLAYALSCLPLLSLVFPSDKRTIWALLLRQWPCALIRSSGTYERSHVRRRTHCTLD